MKKVKLIKLVSISLIGAFILTGCGSSKKATNGGKYDENSKVELTWMNILHTASPPTDTIISKIEEKTNSTLTFSWIPDASKEERINTAIASDSLADIVSLPILENSSVRNALKSNMFWNIEDYLDEFPNLKAMSDEVVVSASIEGKLYGVPFQKDLARNGIVIRKDWLDNLGLDVPTTTEELMTVAKAFTEKDPDKNGQKDTTGFVDRSDLVYGAFKTLGSYMGVPNYWEVNGKGKFTPEFMTDAYVAAMEYMNKLYKNKWINQDFAVTAKMDQQQNFAQGKAGIYVGNLIDAANLKQMSKGIQENMELVMINDMTSALESERHIWSDKNGIGGLLAFPRSEVKDEAELKRVLKFVNDIMEKEIHVLMTFGIEDVHYNINDKEEYEIINQNLWQQEVQPFASSRPRENGFRLQTTDQLKNEANKLIQDNEKYAVLNPAFSLESATDTTEGSELEKIITDATYQYILGEISIEKYWEAVDKWKASGGSTIIKEYEAAYKEHK